MILTQLRAVARERVLPLALLLTMLVMALSLLAAKPAQAKTFTVTSDSLDSSDIAPGDGICDTLSVQLLNPCTLRGAIQEANAFPGADKIYFDIPLGGVQTIKPNGPLPFVTEQVTIDGYTQPGATKNTIEVGATNAKLLIELNGENAGKPSSGLVVSAGNCVVRGLNINRFGANGVWLWGNAAGTKIEGNFLGTDPSGTLDRGNIGSGVGNFHDFGPSDVTVGGTPPAARNLISGNGDEGVLVANESTDMKVIGNLIGTQKNGSSSLGNTGNGVRITADGGVDITDNTIAFNGEDGVLITYGINNSVLSNSIHFNVESGIDLWTELGDDGATLNDDKDPDTGANNLQNKPLLSSATNSGPNTTIKGSLNSKPNKQFTVQFFSNPVSNEGKKFIGQKSFTTNKNGNVSITFSPAQKVAVGQNVTATATDPNGNTSEFSAPRNVT